jgi:hypothetical protein
VEIRSYNPETDLDAVQRIWREVGWIDAGDDDHAEGLRIFAEQYEGRVAVIDGAPECYVATGPGSIRHTTEDLTLSIVAAVTTSHVVRRQGFAKRLTAQSIAADAANGAAVCALGMFDQGFYNKLGFGTNAYEYWHSIDPAAIRVKATARTPKRLSKGDWEAIHRSRLNRLRGHGSCNLTNTAATQAEMHWASNGFGLGYTDGPDGELTHHIWFSAKEMEFGPINAWWMSYETLEQFLELMALLSNLGDSVHLVRMREPAAVQVQDLIDQPFRRMRNTEKSGYENRTRAAAYGQTRICDLAVCMAATKLQGDPVHFNLKLSDPIEDALDADSAWRGIAGDYVVTFGPESSAASGTDASLPTLTAAVGAFTRLWLGVRPATGLAVTDDLSGPAELLEELDRVLCLPTPKPDWDF